ncbi:MAG: thioredoxin family protein [Pseudomonadota bacterium]
MNIHVMLVMLLVLTACGQPTPGTENEPAPASIKPATEHKAAGIHWFGGSVDQAFAMAKTDNKPVFLYWGAVWCPPCHELKATVFQEPSFIQASRQFVPVYLDGDTPGAQKYAEQYGVMGYPTLVVFNTSGEELTRIPNGLDLGAYANVLQYALNDLQPIGKITQRILTELEQPTIALNEAECRMLAQHSWQQDPEPLEPAVLGEVFSAAALHCPTSAAKDKAALSVMQLQQQMLATTDSDGKVKLTDTDKQRAAQQLSTLLDRPLQLQSNMYLFLATGESLAAILTPELQTRFETLYENMADNVDSDLFQRIQSLRALVGLNKALDANLNEGVLTRISALRSEAEKMDRADPQFHATINATGNMLVESGQLTEAKELLSAEVSRSKYVYYFMGELADIEQKLGNADAAIEWRRKAFDQARGPATRFQWGVNYLRTVLELDADNLEAVRSGFDEVFAELAASKSMYQRSRTRLEGLDESLRAWAGDNAPRMAALAEFRRTTQTHCLSLPATEQAKSYCESFLYTSEA